MLYNLFTFLLVITNFFCCTIYGQQTSIFSKTQLKKILLRVANRQMQQSNKKPLNDLTNGALYTGIFAAYQLTKSQLLFDSLMTMGNRYQWRQRRRFDHADDYAITQTYRLLYSNEDHLFASDASYLIVLNGNGKFEW